MTAPQPPEATETAWRIHAAISDWTRKVDTKASFALGIESAVLAGVVTLAGDGHRLAGLTGRWEILFFWLGVAFLISGVLAAVSVVRPRLRDENLVWEARDNFIYFGHLQHWEADELAKALAERPALPVLTRQLINMSKIAWRKHQAVQWSMTLAVVGTLLVGIAAAINS